VPAPREIVERLGGHPAGALGLDLDCDEGLFGWLVTACLLSGRAPEARALDAYRRLSEQALAAREALAAGRVEAVAAELAKADYPRPERTAPLLARLARGVEGGGGGSLSSLAAEALDLAELGGALVRLAPGVGQTTVLRFLRPLRGRWPAAAETPLAAPARAAALHLGWIGEAEDEEGAPGALTRRLEDDPDPPQLADLEAALERLGRRSCAAERPDRCPLADLCPRWPDRPEGG
jgi:endonuclease III